MWPMLYEFISRAHYGAVMLKKFMNLKNDLWGLEKIQKFHKFVLTLQSQRILVQNEAQFLEVTVHYRFCTSMGRFCPAGKVLSKLYKKIK